jgi:hypothetical protein
MSLSVAAVVAVIVLPVVVLIAWGMWLTFAALIAKWYGIDGLKTLRHVSDGFHPRDWALLIPRQGLAGMSTMLSTMRGAATARSPGSPIPIADTTWQGHPPPDLDAAECSDETGDPHDAP